MPTCLTRVVPVHVIQTFLNHYLEHHDLPVASDLPTLDSLASHPGEFGIGPDLDQPFPWKPAGEGKEGPLSGQ